jgi:predicted small integral membrane protein
MCRSIMVCGKRGFQACYLCGASGGRPTLCSRRNDPAEPCERALCISALCIYNSLDLSHAFLMLYDIMSNYLIGMLNCCSWSGFKRWIRFVFSWYGALIFSSKV